MTVASAEREHTLYRLYNSKRDLLYVGITSSLPARIEHHRALKEWWPEVSQITMETYPDREHAAAAETEAIVMEGPEHNLYRSQGKTPLHSFRISDDEWKAGQAAASRRGENFSEELRKMVRRYINRKD